jgi:hypothetical protein
VLPLVFHEPSPSYGGGGFYLGRVSDANG